jgi:hypothetical protein
METRAAFVLVLDMIPNLKNYIAKFFIWFCAAGVYGLRLEKIEKRREFLRRKAN